MFVTLSLVSVPFGLLVVLFSLVGLLVSDFASSQRLAAIGFWALWLAALVSERLRLWPFHRIDQSKHA